MKLGAFLMPNHPPGRDYSEGHYHNLEYLSFLDSTGFHEAWIGEHYTVPREPLPSPDLLIAQALIRTENIKLAPGAFLLPYHHPVELAHRISWLDHISGGRCFFGIGSSGVSTDLAMFNVDGLSGENRDMTEESLYIMRRFWESEDPFEFTGKFWTVRRPESEVGGNFSFHLKPATKPHPQLGIAGLSPHSPTLKLAGHHGMIPLSLCLSNAYLESHWSSIKEGAEKAGKVADRTKWRVGRDIFVADTDAEAKRLAINSLMGDNYNSYFLPLFKHYNLMSALKHDLDVPDSDVTLDYLAENCWLVGSPTTVADKISDMLEQSGGFGCLLATSYDHLDTFSAWRESKLALAHEVIPKFENSQAALA
ncbi:MAG: LLM class flavin-dependent oxidoreductase [Pseudomonadota bacterium]|nr:LLM class flavin-dependent oxidoreductase [Pseudomonadota bacterium]